MNTISGTSETLACGYAAGPIERRGGHNITTLQCKGRWGGGQDGMGGEGEMRGDL